MSGDLGDRMKMYEAAEAKRSFIPGLPVMVRVDGRTFSRATKHLDRPFDRHFTDAMDVVTRALVEETNARVGYTQSDEISLVLHVDTKAEPYFGGRIQKVVGSLAALASTVFNATTDIMRGDVTFDCRAWNVPSFTEAANTILWREVDATKNSVSMLARCHFSHRRLHKLGRVDQIALLESEGVRWDELPARHKRGQFFRRVTRSGKFTAEEIAELPPGHRARHDPDVTFTRSRVEAIDMPPFGRVANRPQVIFYGATPQVIDGPRIPPCSDFVTTISNAWTEPCCLRCGAPEGAHE